MESSILEQVLACERVPSLPAVAVQVLEMMKDDNVSVAAIAEVVQHDQGLTTKILKTVNSSFYGLSKPCGSLKQAQLLLGLNALKTLALGFSLVASLGRDQDDSFDYESYWRRSIISGVAGKAIAAEIRCAGAEDAFLGGLLQDVGMIALQKTLGKRYAKVVESCGEAHELLAAAELEAWETAHPDVGAVLAEKWRLPMSLIAPIKHHENPTAGPKGHQTIIRCVGLGNLAAAALSREDATPWVSKFVTRAQEWFAIERSIAEDLLRKIGHGAKIVSHLLETPIGAAPVVQNVLEEANERLQSLSLDREREVERTLAENQRMHESMSKDAMTGLGSRRFINEALKRAFNAAKSQNSALAFMLIDVDSFHRVNDAHGWEIGDASLVALAQRLTGVLRSLRRAHLGRFGGEEFVVLLPDCERAMASALAERIRAEISTEPIQPVSVGAPLLDLSVSVGVAVLDRETHIVFDRAEQLINAADRAVNAAKGTGGNCVRVFVPKSRAA